MESYSKTDYRKKVEAIFKRFPSVQKVPFGEAYKPGLEHIEKFCSCLGDPQRKYRTIHVAGTNGKGSVANMLSAALVSSGLKVGLFTSPHIVDFRERMRIGSELVSEEYVWDFLCRYEEEMERLDLSFFEITTGMAFKWFEDMGVDVAVIETGLGGRLDSTNIIVPDLSIVTNIALDHCAILGSTLEAIAFEKAGIFKPGVPALVGEYLPETRPVFEKKAAETGSSLTFAEDVAPSMLHRSEAILKKMDLRGEYQKKNLRTVFAAIDILKDIPFYGALADQAAVETAIARTASIMGFHGRWERLSLHPFIIADIGHNPAALTENFSQLRRMQEDGECSSLIIVYAVMADKDLDGIMPLMPQDATYIFTNPEIHRALPEAELTSRYKAFCSAEGRPVNRIYEAPTVRQALSMAITLAKQTSRKTDQARAAFPLIFIGGSTYLVSEAVQILKSLQGF